MHRELRLHFAAELRVLGDVGLLRRLLASHEVNNLLRLISLPDQPLVDAVALKVPQQRLSLGRNHLAGRLLREKLKQAFDLLELVFPCNQLQLLSAASVEEVVCLVDPVEDFNAKVELLVVERQAKHALSDPLELQPQLRLKHGSVVVLKADQDRLCLLSPLLVELQVPYEHATVEVLMGLLRVDVTHSLLYPESVRVVEQPPHVVARETSVQERRRPWHPLTHAFSESLVVRVLSLEFVKLNEAFIEDLEDGEVLGNVVIPCILL